MRHNKKVNHLGRTSEHRKALLSNMASSLIENKRITTTVAKAKALKKYVEPLITKAKSDTTHSRRVVFSYLQNKNTVSILFRDVAEKVADRPGGYTRILKTGNRLGDNAEMCIIELVDYNEAMLAAKDDAAKAKKRRSRRSGSAKKEADAPVATKTKQAEKAAEVVEEIKPVEETEELTETTTETPVEAPEATDEVTEVPETTDDDATETPEAISEEENKEE